MRHDPYQIPSLETAELIVEPWSSRQLFRPDQREDVPLQAARKQGSVSAEWGRKALRIRNVGRVGAEGSSDTHDRARGDRPCDQVSSAQSRKLTTYHSVQRAHEVERSLVTPPVTESRCS